MRAPNPALQRLFGQASAPARLAAAWRTLDAMADRLDPALASPAEGAASLAAWGPGRQVAARLGPLLDHLLGGSPAAQAEAPGPQARIGPHAPGEPGLALALALQPASAPGIAARPQAWPRPSRPARAAWPGPRAQLPVAPQAASAGTLAASATPPVNLHAPASTAGADQGDGTAAVRPVPQLLRLPGAARRASNDTPDRHDKPAARVQWQQRISQAGLSAAWQAPMATARTPHTNALSPGLAESRLPASLQPLGPASASSVDAQVSAAPADRLASTLGRLAGPTPAPHRALADTPAAAAVRPPAPALDPASWPAARALGGFKGLALLGRPGVAAEPAGQADRAGVPAIPRPATASSAWPTPGGPDDAQQVIDQVEAALREQAERSGIVLGRGWP